MATREEIREGIKCIIEVNRDKFPKCFASELKDELLEELTSWITDKILWNLHSQGVVIKADRELPDFSVFDAKMTTKSWNVFRKVTQEDLDKAGYEGTIPLVEE